jgi:hypothetical protein
LAGPCVRLPVQESRYIISRKRKGRGRRGRRSGTSEQFRVAHCLLSAVRQWSASLSPSSLLVPKPIVQVSVPSKPLRLCVSSANLCQFRFVRFFYSREDYFRKWSILVVSNKLCRSSSTHRFWLLHIYIYVYTSVIVECCWIPSYSPPWSLSIPRKRPPSPPAPNQRRNLPTETFFYITISPILE